MRYTCNTKHASHQLSLTSMLVVFCATLTGMLVVYWACALTYWALTYCAAEAVCRIWANAHAGATRTATNILCHGQVESEDTPAVSRDFVAQLLARNAEAAARCAAISVSYQAPHNVRLLFHASSSAAAQAGCLLEQVARCVF